MNRKQLIVRFIESEKSGSIVLLLCTVASLVLANTSMQSAYTSFWHTSVAGHGIDHWVNDGLMTIFFLLIGLELEREVYIGELSTIKNALLPIIAAIGGMAVPTLIHFLFNGGTPTQAGIGIPMATDIAFAIGILSLMGKRVPVSLKVFLTALAVIDDLGAIFVIAFFYSSGLSLLNLGVAMGIFTAMLILNRLKVHSIVPYLIGGVAMWYFMLHSGVHATITGVLLAFAIPFDDGSRQSSSYRLQHWLHLPVSFVILPIFALANTSIILPSDWTSGLTSLNSLGIFFGLVIGKPLGIFLFSFVAVVTGLCALPTGLRWKELAGAGFLGGIGFTMSIFITLLAFNSESIINDSKIVILIASVTASVFGFVWLYIVLKSKPREK